MPFKDPERRKLHHRNSMRKHVHGRNWRAVLLKYGFMCASAMLSPLPDDCDPMGSLEMHLDSNDNTVLLCNFCHSSTHLGGFSAYRGNPSMVYDDVMREIEKCGSEEDWIVKYKVRAA